MTYNELQAMTHEELVNMVMKLEDSLKTRSDCYIKLQEEYENLSQKHRSFRAIVHNLVLLTK